MVIDFGLIRAAASTAKRLLPKAAQLMTLVRQAAEGDVDAQQYLRENGLHDALEVLGPGLGDAANTIWRDTRATVDHFANGGRDVVEGEFRELHPWTHYQQWLANQEWGVWVILGPKGQGKTTWARRLAEVFSQRLGYPIEGVNLYPEDQDDELRPISMKTLEKRVQLLRRYLAVHGRTDPEEEVEDESAVEKAGIVVENALGMDPERVRQVREQARQERVAAAADALEASYEAMRGRVVIVDEASLEIGSHGSDAGRRIIRQLGAQARHLNYHLIYIGQLARMLPLDTFTCESVFVKKPNGDEHELDRPEPLIQNLWASAHDTFRKLRGSPWKEQFPDTRSWLHVDCRGRYSGPMPFYLPGRANHTEEATDAHQVA